MPRLRERRPAALLAALVLGIVVSALPATAARAQTDNAPASGGPAASDPQAPASPAKPKPKPKPRPKPKKVDAAQDPSKDAGNKPQPAAAAAGPCAGLQGLALEQCRSCDKPGRHEALRQMCRDSKAIVYCAMNVMKNDPACQGRSNPSVVSP